MKSKFFCIGLCLCLLSACGPIIGGMMVAGSKVEDFQVIQGDLNALRAGSQLVVLGPFDKTPEAFYICRGEDAAAFATAFNESGLFSAHLKVDTRFPEDLPQADDFKGQTPEAVKSSLKLDESPDFLMSGTILSREMVAAPAQGVLMTAAYRLNFLDVQSGQTTVIEVRTKELFHDVIPLTVKYLSEQMGL